MSQEMGQKKKIDKGMRIDEIFSTFPERAQKLAQLMTNKGLACVGCGAAAWETLEAGMLSHGFDEEAIDQMVIDLNAILSQELDLDTIKMTERAAKKFREFAKLEGKEGAALRFGCKPGGCSGFEYVLDFEMEPGEHDEVFSSFDVGIFVNKEVLGRLLGCEIDYQDGLSGSGFKISNPNAKGSCSCGSSQNY
ncbi:MAG: Iron-sulfur cluster insertion protein ErpA [Chlamydiia bacterium]|nr:Iron-sulfur cluster insertion protein ErpA [Chlamydiia bacterium]